jgi:hypothetical protein
LRGMKFARQAMIIPSSGAHSYLLGKHHDSSETDPVGAPVDSTIGRR